MVRKQKTKYMMLPVLALAVLIPATGLAGVDKGTQDINDNRLLSHLYGLTQNGTFTTDGDGITHEFVTTLGEDGS